MNKADENVIIIDENASKNIAPVAIAKGEKFTKEDGSVVIQLHHPKVILFRKDNSDHREDLAQITVKRPTGADLRTIQKVRDDMDRAVRAFETLTGHPAVIFDKLDIADIRLISEVVQEMMGESP